MSEQGDVAVIREALNSTPLPRRDPDEPGWKHLEDALAALDRLAALLRETQEWGEGLKDRAKVVEVALERAERERDNWHREYLKAYRSLHA